MWFVCERQIFTVVYGLPLFLGPKSQLLVWDVSMKARFEPSQGLANRHRPGASVEEIPEIVCFGEPPESLEWTRNACSTTASNVEGKDVAVFSNVTQMRFVGVGVCLVVSSTFCFETVF